ANNSAASNNSYNDRAAGLQNAGQNNYAQPQPQPQRAANANGGNSLQQQQQQPIATQPAGGPEQTGGAGRGSTAAAAASGNNSVPAGLTNAPPGAAIAPDADGATYVTNGVYFVRLTANQQAE